MHATSSTVMYIWTPATSPRPRHTSSQRERSACTTASTLAMDGSFITQVSHTGRGSDRWNRFLSSVSQAPESSAFNPGSDASTVARWWREQSRVWADPATGS